MFQLNNFRKEEETCGTTSKVTQLQQLYFGSYWSCRPRTNYSGGICKNATITCHFGFLFEENLVREFTWFCDAIVVEKFRFQNVFRPHENVKPSFSNSSVLKSVSEKLRFLDVLVWGVDLTVEIKLCFEISPVDATSVTCVVFVLFWMQAVAKFTFFHSKMSCIEFNRKTLNLSWSLCYSFGHLRMEVTRAKLHSLQVMSDCIPSLLIHLNGFFHSTASNWGQNIRLSEWVVISY